MITENNLHDDNRSYRYQQNAQEQHEQQNQVPKIDNQDKKYNDNEEYLFEIINESRNQNMAANINENNTSEYTTPESTTSAQNISQTETSTTTQFVRIPTKTVNPRQNIHNPQSSLNISPQRYITFELPPSPDEEVQNETQNITSIPNTCVNVLSPTRINPSTTRDIARSIYDPSSVPSIYKHTNKTRQSTSIQTIFTKLLVHTIIHLVNPFFHHLIQISPHAISINMLLKIIIIPI